MTKARLMVTIVEAAGISWKQAEAALKAVTDAIEGELAKGEAVTLQGFGAFYPKVRAARTGRNPQTGERIQIPETKVAAFRPGKHLKDAVNGRS